MLELVNVNINNYIAVFQSKYTTVFVLLEYQNRNNSRRPECALSFNLEKVSNKNLIAITLL
jgi:hypothetical protein